jgi:hypothetical protein
MQALNVPRRDWLFVAVLTALYLALAVCWQDISYFDETFYMDSGNHFALGDLIHQLQFAPLYALWYRVLGFILPWPLCRYFGSWVILVVVSLFLPVWTRLRNAWLYAWLLVCVPFFGYSNFSFSPYVNLFAACLLVAGACLIRARDLGLDDAAWVAFITCFVVAFARPEFAFLVPVLAMLYFAVSWTQSARRSRSRVWLKACAVLAPTALMLLILRHGGGSRSGVAIAQHFNLRAAEKHLIPGGQDPWTSDYALRLFHVDPGNNAATTSATIFQFIQANPRLFLEHLLANLATPLTWCAFLVLYLALSVPFWPGKLSSERVRSLRPLSLYTVLVSLASLVAVLSIYPDQRYFFTLLPVFLLYVTQLADAFVPVDARWQPWLLAAGLPIIVLTTVGWSQLKERRLLLPHPVLDTVACLDDLQRIPTTPNHTIFETVGVAAGLLTEPHRGVEMWDIRRWDEFQSWIRASRPAWVEVNPAVHSFYGVSDSDLDAYLVSQRYTAHPCPANARFSPLNVYVAAP